jgi:hypothetical protein
MKIQLRCQANNAASALKVGSADRAAFPACSRRLPVRVAGNEGIEMDSAQSPGATAYRPISRAAGCVNNAPCASLMGAKNGVKKVGVGLQKISAGDWPYL